MRSPLDCVLCLTRQSLDAARLATTDVDLQRQVLESAFKIFLEKGLDAPAPLLATLVHRSMREITGVVDPYYAEKKHFNRLSLEQLPRFRRWVEESPTPFETLVRLAIAGNSIDIFFGELDEAMIEAAIKAGLDQTLVGSVAELEKAIRDADSILYVTDNAGEVVFDRLFIETLISEDWGKKVTVALRGAPILNDATLEDAEEIGLSAIVPTIDNGSDGLGVLFDITSQEFNDAFVGADLVIAKGLANWETLECDPGPFHPKKIAFLFKAKCKFIAEEVGAQLGDLVVSIR
ncbi:MAG: DUF89 family protein [Thermoguttaceae bacterium]|nr:DUF89 family protein [Thermoguttaceae bacterium]